MNRAIVAAVLLLLAGCSEDPVCYGSTLRLLPAQPGEISRYEYLECDGVTPRLVCVRTEAAVTCVGDTSPVCC